MPPDRRSTDEQVIELRGATENLAAQVANLQDTIATVTDLQAGQQKIEQAQQEIERKVVFKEAFDQAWKTNAARLEKIGRTNRRMALTSLISVLVIFGSAGGWLVDRQLNVNHDTTRLNAQRVAACEQKNSGSQVARGYVNGLISREQALRQPDPVFTDFLRGIRKYIESQIVPCPGAPSVVPSSAS